MSNRIKQLFKQSRSRSLHPNAQMIHPKRVTRKVCQVLGKNLKGSLSGREEPPHLSGVDVFSSSLIIGAIFHLREIFFPKLLMGWRSSQLKILLVSFGRDFTTRPLAIIAVFFSSYLFFHTLLAPVQGLSGRELVVKGFWVLLPLSGLLVKADLKSLLSSSLVFHALRKILRSSQPPVQPNGV